MWEVEERERSSGGGGTVAEEERGVGRPRGQWQIDLSRTSVRGEGPRGRKASGVVWGVAAGGACTAGGVKSVCRRCFSCGR